MSPRKEDTGQKESPSDRHAPLEFIVEKTRYGFE